MARANAVDDHCHDCVSLHPPTLEWLSGSNQKGYRPTPVERLRPHPEALAAFSTYAGVGLVARLPIALTQPLLAVRQGQEALFFAGFASRLACRQRPMIPVIFVPDITSEAIAVTAWLEVCRLPYQQLEPRGGHADLYKALQQVPPPIRATLFGSEVSDRALGRLLHVDPKRFRR